MNGGADDGVRWTLGATLGLAILAAARQATAAKVVPLDRHARRGSSAGPFRVVNTPKRAMLSIGGLEYSLSDFAGSLYPTTTEWEAIEASQAQTTRGAKLIAGPAPQDPYRFLWIVDRTRRKVAMWRVADGNLKIFGSIDEYVDTIARLSQAREITHVDHAVFVTIDEAMKRRENQLITSLTTAIEQGKTDDQRAVDRAVRALYEREVRPRLVALRDRWGREDRQRAIEQEMAVVRLGGVESPMDRRRRHEAEISAVLQERFALPTIEDALRIAGLDRDAPGADGQAAYWAQNEVTDVAFEEFGDG